MIFLTVNVFLRNRFRYPEQFSEKYNNPADRSVRSMIPVCKIPDLSFPVSAGERQEKSFI